MIPGIVAGGMGVGGGGDSDPYWANVVSLLNFNGPDGSTTFTDAKGRVWTPHGNAKISTARSPFGGVGSSMYLDGSGDWISADSSADFDFGSDDFTIEGWIYPEANRTGAIFQRRNNYNTASSFGLTADQSGKLRFSLASGSSGYAVDMYSSNAVPLNAWSHCEIDRAGVDFFLFINGALEATASSSAVMRTLNERVFIGSNGATSPSTYQKGNTGPVRVTRGVARHTSSFSVPSSTFPTT